MRGSKRQGFTLIEIMVVIVIIGMMAAAVLPRVSFFSEPPLTLLQRCVDEACDKALTGVSIRFVLQTEKDSKRGKIVAEALVKKEEESSALSKFLDNEDKKPEHETLEWMPVELAYPIEDTGWSMEPDIVYFFTDGSCTPAAVSWAAPGSSERDAENFILTVTGYCVSVPSSR